MGSTNFVQGPAPGPVKLLTDTGDVWDPRKFTFTAEDGTVYDLDQDKGVRQLTDRNGNTLVVSEAGLLHSSGKSIAFDRDAQNRITKITDPMGQVLTYEYDSRGDLVAFTDRDSNRSTFTYAGNHYLQDIFDPLGRRPIRNEYDDSGRLLKHIDALGKEIVYTHDLPANTEEITDRLGSSTFYVYNDMGDVVKKTDALGKEWVKSYDPRGNVLTETDPLGHTITRTFDGMDNQLTEKDALGKTSTYTYNPYRQLLTTTDPLGHGTANTYDSSGNLSTTADPLGNVTTYTYDGKGNKLTATDPLGNPTKYEYDANANVTKATDALGHARSYTYDADDRKLTETSTRLMPTGPQSLVTVYEYDAAGHLLTTTSPDGTTRQTIWTPTGKRSTAIDELGRRTSHIYDGLDRLVTTTYADGTTDTATFDAENHRLTSTDPGGHTTTFAYDAAGRQTTTTHPDASSTTTSYDAAGNVTAMTDELGKSTSYGLDAANRRVSTTDPLGHITQAVFDDAGREIASIDALGHSTIRTLDAAGRVTATTYEDGSTTAAAYDTVGRQTSKTDELGHVTTFGYDALGRLVSVKDALNHVTQYAYDEVGDRISQTDANGHTTAFEYDALGRETRRTLPDGKYEGKGYDQAGRLQSKVDFARRLITYAYDARDHLISRSYADGTTVGFTYTTDGQRATATDARGTTGYTYDSRHHLSRMKYPDGRMLDYAYDARGARTSLTARIGAQGFATGMTYDAAGMPDHVTDLLGRVYDADYDAAGDRTALAYPNTTKTTYTYDSRNRLKTLTAQQVTAGATSTLIQSQTYTMDAAGRRTSIAEGDSTSRAYGYDNTDRLTSETVTGAAPYTRAFTYDAVGNRTEQTKTGIGTGTTSYGYDNRDELLTENATAYTYDSNGDLTAKSGRATYAWDLENRLIRVTKTEGTKVEHNYDADGNRVQTTVTPASGATKTTNYLVDTAGGLTQVIADTDGTTGALAALYLRHGDELLAVLRSDGRGGYATRWVHHDGIGSVRALTDETGVTTDTKSYEAFGSVLTMAGTDPLPYGFAGEAYDATSSLAYHRARWMDARVGRFLGMDPGMSGGAGAFEFNEIANGTNAYAYVLGDPTSGTDSTGFAPDDGFPSADAAAWDALRWTRATYRSASRVEWGGVIYFNPYAEDQKKAYSYTSPFSESLPDEINPARIIDLTEPWLDAVDGKGFAVYHTHPNLRDSSHDPDYFSPDDRLAAYTVTNRFNLLNTKMKGVPNYGSVYLGTPKGVVWRFDDYAAFHQTDNIGRILMSPFRDHDIRIRGGGLVGTGIGGSFGGGLGGF